MHLSTILSTTSVCSSVKLLQVLLLRSFWIISMFVVCHSRGISGWLKFRWRNRSGKRLAWIIDWFMNKIKYGSYLLIMMKCPRFMFFRLFWSSYQQSYPQFLVIFFRKCWKYWIFPIQCCLGIYLHISASCAPAVFKIIQFVN